MSTFEIRFSDGTADSTNLGEPRVASGDLGDVFVYRVIQNLKGLHCDRLDGPTKVFISFEKAPIIIGRWRFGLPRIRIFKIRVDYINLELSIVGQLNYQNPPVSQNPHAPSVQVQVYDGIMRLSWQNTEFPYVFLVQTGERLRGPGGSTDIQARVTTSYHVAIDPQGDPVFTHPDTGAVDVIKGELSGDMQPPVLPNAAPHVTATFDSQRPIRWGEPVAEFLVKDTVMRGNWL